MRRIMLALTVLVGALALLLPLTIGAQVQNQPPSAVDDLTAVTEGEAIAIDARANDSDPDGDPFLISALGGSPQGVVSITGGGTGISYDENFAVSPPGTPDEPGSANDTFTYTITDSHGAEATATVTVVVWNAGVDYAAVCSPLTVSDATVTPGQTITVAATAVTAGSTIHIELDGTSIGTTTSFNNGSFDVFSTTVTIPNGTSPGNHLLQAVQYISPTQPKGCPSQVASIEVAGAGPTCQGQPATIHVNNQNVIVGGPRNGRPYRGELNGTPGADVMVGTAGNDEFAARAGHDLICGLGGNDEMEAAGGNDTMTGGPGADKFIGGAGRDTATDFNAGEGDTKRSVP
jgi:Ca2+-binding RTX toxin-like protein